MASPFKLAVRLILTDIAIPLQHAHRLVAGARAFPCAGRCAGQ
jgi:hypothetical protein